MPENDQALEPEFVLGGHSHKWAMGAPRDYKGPRGLVPGKAFDRTGYYFLEENGGPRTDQYWTDFANSSRDRDAIVVWNGNQHYMTYLFDVSPNIDFLEPTLQSNIREGAFIVPRRLIVAQMAPSIAPLKSFLARVREAGAHSISVVGTPPPRGDLAIFTASIRGGWREVAQNLGIDIDITPVMPAQFLLKIWRVMQKMLAEAAEAVEGRFVDVPELALTPEGFLKHEYTLEKDFTHATDSFGNLMLGLSISRPP